MGRPWSMKGHTMQSIESLDVEELTDLLDMTLNFAANTWTDAAYYLLLAAHRVAFTDHLHRQVINTARFLGTDDYYRTSLDMAGIDHNSGDFLQLARTMTQECIELNVFSDELMEAPTTHTGASAATALQEAFEVSAESRESDRKARADAYERALAYRNHRMRDDT